MRRHRSNPDGATLDLWGWRADASTMPGGVPARPQTPPGFTFYLGTHRPLWLAELSIPLFVSYRTISKVGRLPVARGPWALDSGGFTELNMHGCWKIPAKQYADDVRRYQREVGNLQWCAPQDWMCEREVLCKTKLTIPEHQRRTVRSYLELRDMGIPVIPVLQGWAAHDYMDCIDLYENAGVNLRAEPVVGVGTMCRRKVVTAGSMWIFKAALLFDQLSANYGLHLHAFGLQKNGLSFELPLGPGGRPTEVWQMLASSDSLAWSDAARHRPPRNACRGKHQHCNNCMDFALEWRDDLIGAIAPMAHV
jgi:hypothetical protein